MPCSACRSASAPPEIDAWALTSRNSAPRARLAAKKSDGVEAHESGLLRLGDASLGPFLRDLHLLPAHAQIHPVNFSTLSDQPLQTRPKHTHTPRTHVSLLKRTTSLSRGAATHASLRRPPRRRAARAPALPRHGHGGRGEFAAAHDRALLPNRERLFSSVTHRRNRVRCAQTKHTTAAPAARAEQVKAERAEPQKGP